mmetsp:Transcript_22245/g.65930  ORF Transcript_22245/g.65930 Transcript_22245/m.65930 type:complete len:141 (+) Transcript_22245:38-460(+)
MALSVEPDALDTLLSLQLRIVEEQLGRRRATDGAGDVWHHELAARQKRLDELDRQNARMAQELDRAVTQGPRARPPPAPPPCPHRAGARGRGERRQACGAAAASGATRAAPIAPSPRAPPPERERPPSSASSRRRGRRRR